MSSSPLADTRIGQEAPARALLLSKEEHKKYAAYLNSDESVPFDMSASVLSGSIGVQESILKKAARITHIFHRVCRALHAKMQTDTELRNKLLRPLSSLPIAKESACSAEFFLQFFRLDFFTDAKSGDLHIMELNSGGASLTDFLQCTRYLKKHHSFKPPAGFLPLETSTMLECVLSHCEKQNVKTLGFVAIENGVIDYLWEYLEYARWMQKNSHIRPVFLELTNGVLSPISHKDVPCDFSDLRELDCVFSDWFEDLPGLERVQKQLNECGIKTIPARSDILFESKHFLSVLPHIEKPTAINTEDWLILQSVLLPSFPLEELCDRLEEIRSWPGCVLKMDIDCASENVHVYDFSKISFEEVMKKLSRGQKEATWTIQKFVQPPKLPMSGPTPKWIEYDYTKYKFDLMTYMCIVNNKPHVLFGSRLFSLDKWDELTEEGREDGMYCPIATI